MIRSLVNPGESQTRFLQAYLAAGEQRPRFIERFTAFSPRVFICLVSQADLDSALRLQLVDVALAHLPTSKQRIDSLVSGYLSAHYAEFTVLTSDATTPAQAERICALFADASVTVPRLEPLGRRILPSFVSRNLYEVTHENLAIAIDSAATVALDVIHAANETVYDYVLRHLSTYLKAIDGVSTSIDANEHFLTVIEDVLRQGAPRLGDVVERAAPGCKAADLAEVSEDAWPTLAEHKRFPATFSNVSRYFATLGSVDASLAKILASADKITDISTADEESKIALAVAILAATDQLPSAALRVGLVASLSLDDYLAVDDIAAEVGELSALLLKHNIIADNARSYEHLTATDWPTRKAFIRESGSFSSYMTPALMGADLAVLLTSDEIDLAIKGVVVEHASEYAEAAGTRGLAELARFATRYGHELPPNVVQKMAQGRVAAAQIILLLEPHLVSISRDQLFTILQALGGDYSQLTEVGYDKPRIPNTPADRALLERLKRDGIVGKYDEHESPIKVNKRYK